MVAGDEVRSYLPQRVLTCNPYETFFPQLMCVPGTRSQASALYLLCYFLGFRIGGSAGCLAYSDAGWPGLVAMVSGLLVLALIPAARLTLPSRTAGKDAGYTVVVPAP